MKFPNTITEAHTLLKSSKISPSELLDEIVKNIQKAEPQVKAWKYLQIDAAKVKAKILDKKLSSIQELPSLFGIPYGAKDIISTQGVPTECGSKVLEGHIPEEDATIIKKLVAQDAILLGKTTTTEFANLGNPPPTTNAWNPRHTPGGSSSGSAAAMGARMALFTLGTQTAGSLSRPAAFNGVTALKATYGRISKAGVFPCGRSLDHVGAFTFSVADAALVYNALAGEDPQDEATRYLPSQPLCIREKTDYTIGVLEDEYFDNAEDAALLCLNEALEHLKEKGVRVVRVRAPKGFAEAAAAQHVIMQSEVANYHEEKFNVAKELYHPYLQGFIAEGLKITASQYLDAQNKRDKYRIAFNTVFSQVEVLVTPTTLGVAPEGIAATGSPVFNLPFTSMGVPTLNVPVGFNQDDSLPLGMQLIAPHLQEQRLIDLGCSYQHTTDWHLRRPAVSR